MKKYKIIATSFLIIFIFIYTLINKDRIFNDQALNPSNSPSIDKSVLGERIKSSECVINNSMPDKECTPGSIIETATKEQVCTPGYSRSVRNVSVETKKEVYEEYGIYQRKSGEYQVDHLISLSLGGSNDISNLWPEPKSPKPGYLEKDKVEYYLYQKLCSGRISLSQAQYLILHWKEIYASL